MRIFRHTIWIAKSPDAVFDFFVDFPQAPRWRRFVNQMRLVGAGPLGPGAVVAVSMDIGGTTHDFNLTVLACERPRLWRHRADETYYKGWIEYTFTPDREGTQVTMSMTVRPIGMWGWLGLPLVWLRSGRSYASQLPGLKRAVEG